MYMYCFAVCSFKTELIYKDGWEDVVAGTCQIVGPSKNISECMTSNV